MQIIVIFFLVAFVAIFVFAKVNHKNITLETLEALPGETTLLELDGLNELEYRKFGRATKWINC